MTLIEVMEKYPDLDESGFRFLEGKRRSVSLDEWMAKRERDRASLAASEAEFEFCRTWLPANLVPTKAIGSRGHDAYYLKHVAERDAHEHGNYISEGVLVAALLSLGDAYPVRIHRLRGNVTVGVTKRSLSVTLDRQAAQRAIRYAQVQP